MKFCWGIIKDANRGFPFRRCHNPPKYLGFFCSKHWWQPLPFALAALGAAGEGLDWFERITKPSEVVAAPLPGVDAVLGTAPSVRDFVPRPTTIRDFAKRSLLPLVPECDEQLMLDRFEDAGRCYEQHSSVQALVGLAVVDLLRGKHADAVLGLQTALRIDSAFEPAWMLLTSAYEILETQEAWEVSNRLYLSWYDSCECFKAAFGAASMYIHLGRAAEAVEWSKTAIELCSDAGSCAKAYQNLANAEAALGHFDLARSAARSALENDASDPYLYHLHGQILHMLGRHADAAAEIEHGLELAANEPAEVRAMMLSSLGVTVLAGGKPAESIVCFRDAQRLNPDYADAWVNEGAALLELRRCEEALKVIDEGIKIGVLKPQFLLQRIEALECLGRSAKAQAERVRLRDLFPDFKLR